MNVTLDEHSWAFEGGLNVSLHGAVMKGIFEIQHNKLDPREDTMRWCFAKPVQPRPTSFDVESGSGYTTVELERLFIDESSIVARLERSGVEVRKNDQGGWVHELIIPKSFDSKLASQLSGLTLLSSVTSDVANGELIDGLKEHSSLRSLRFKCPIDPYLLGQLESVLPNLHTLELNCAELTHFHCLAIQKCEKLNTLELAGSERLSNLNLLEKLNVRFLYLNNCQLGKNCFEQIADHLKSVVMLRLSSCRTSQDALEPLSRMDSLRKLDVTGDR